MEAPQHPTKRADIEPVLPEGAGGELSGEGSTSNHPPPAEEGGSNTGGSSQEGSNSGSDENGQGGNAADPGFITLSPGESSAVGGGVTAKSVIAQVPKGMNDDDMRYWSTLDTTPPARIIFDSDSFMLWTAGPDKATAVGEEDVLNLRDALKTPDTSLFSSFDTFGWKTASDAFDAAGGPAWKRNAILSIKYGEFVANHGGTVHALYPSSADEAFPDQRLMTLAELPLITGPGTKVTQIVRWDKDTYQAQIAAGAEQNVIWTAGDAQVRPEMDDLTSDPKATDENINPTAADPTAVGGTDGTGDGTGQVEGGGTGDNTGDGTGSDSGCCSPLPCNCQ